MCRCIPLFVFFYILSVKQGPAQDIRSQVDSLRYLGTDAFSCQSVFWRIVARGKGAVPYLLDKISDTTVTNATYKCKNGFLRVGDLAYLALDNIIPLPFMAVTGMQCDVIESGCPPGVFEYIEGNREKFKKQIADWDNRKQKKFRWVKYKNSEITDCYRMNRITGRYELD